MPERIVFLLGLLALFSQTACESKHQHEEQAGKLLVTTPLQTDTSILKDYVCQIQSIRHIELRAQEKGYLQKIFVDEGQLVKKGQLLFKIMPNLYEAELQKAEAEVKFAEIEYQNTKSLSESRIVSPNELSMAKAKLDKARAEAQLARVHLQFTEIRAPFDGIIDRFHVRPGSLVEEGDLLTTLSDNSRMWVYFNVPEAEYLSYFGSNNPAKPTVHLRMANNEVFPYSGTIETIEAVFDNETGNIPFRASFPNPEGLLRHGETGNIRMQEPVKNALLLPQKATFEVLDKRYVYVVDRENKVNSREIVVAAELEDLFIVTSGIQKDEKLLLEGIRKVTNGQKIAYQFRAPEQVVGNLKVAAE